MAHPNENLVGQGFAAYARGVIDALQNQFFAPDLRWHFAGRHRRGIGWAGPAAASAG